MITLSDPVTYLKGLGPKTATALQKHGITTVEDLLYFFPRGWIDASRVTAIRDMRMGVPATLRVKVMHVREGISQRTKLPYLRALLQDDSGSVTAMWFHPRFIKPKVGVGTELLLHGALQGWRAQDATIMSPKILQATSIIPVYSSMQGVAPHRIVSLLRQAKECVEHFPDFIPERVRAEHGLLSLPEAIKTMHWPDNVNSIAEARKRLAFDELMMLVVPSLTSRREREQEKVDALVIDPTMVNAWCKRLPFQLTDDQHQAIQDALEDVASSTPMNRLLQGDVGSGKTVVGLAAALAVIHAGKRVVWLAPTELLARQHVATATQLLRDSGVTCALVTRTYHEICSDGVCSVAARDVCCAQQLVIGTHALLADKITLNDLGLLIIDEQHRFGVKQRAQLRLIGGKPTHLLSMTATPIPRTMALLLYGDLQLSTIKQKPLGRKPVITRVVEAAKREQAYDFLDQVMKVGAQVYVVCPLITPSEEKEVVDIPNELFHFVEDKKSVTTWAQELRERFPHRRIGVLHGQLKAVEKTSVMDQFRQGELDMLVSTTVIEVGVDVPNATCMVIEGAESFGLAQLHQLRGRVGRGDRQSFCLLFPTTEKGNAMKRLKVLESTTDGFVLAEKDLELRGPGEITGLMQSGLPPLRFANLQDGERIQLVRTITEQCLDDPVFRAGYDRFWRLHHPE